MTQLIRTQIEDGILVATIDMPGHTMNVLSQALMDAIDAVIDQAEAEPAVRAVVVTSGKPSFVAGADLSMVKGFCEAGRSTTYAEMTTRVARLGRQYTRLEASAKPWVAAVNGLALGGGLELAMACRTRIAADDARIQLGLPEVRWGLIPGSGGTQRTPRLIGFGPAMQMLLDGLPLNPQKAVAVGLFASAVPADKLLAEAKAAARALMGRPYDPREKYPHLDQPDVPAWSEQARLAVFQRYEIDALQYEKYPAYAAIADSVLKGARLSMEQADVIEVDEVLRLILGPVAPRMIRTLFLERVRADRELGRQVATTLARITVGPISAPHAAWTQALAATKIPCEADAALQPDTVALTDAAGQRHLVALRVLDEPASEAALTQLVLAPAGPYGQVLEIVGPANEAAAALARKLRALPWRTPGPVGLLQKLRGKSLEEQEQIARQALPGAGDPAFVDVAACLSGVSPAWSGGPLSWR